MAEDQAFVLTESAGPIRVIRLNYPARRNALSLELRAALITAVEAAMGDAEVRALVLTGNGGAFCAGGDISEYPAFRYDVASLRHFHEEEVWGALAALQACPVPLVAQIEGACMGAGLEIASCCDIRLAGASARFGAPIAKLGFPMAPREAALVRSQIGDALARDMLLAAGLHPAQRLLTAGFLLDVLPDAEVPDAAWRHAQRIAGLAPQAARLHKATFRALAAGEMKQLLAGAYDYADSAEHREGIDAFLAKRPPRFG